MLTGSISLVFIGLFVYYNYYRGHLRSHWQEFLKRIISTYLISFFIVGLILALIDKTPLEPDWIITVKRIVIISFPTSVSAAVEDMIK